MQNDAIATKLETLADLLEFTGANAFRLRAYRNGAKAIRDLSTPIAAMIEQGDNLSKLDGIGDSVAKKCVELCETGTLEQIETLLTEVPATVLDLLNVPGLGPKKAAVLFNELGVENLALLKSACESNTVQTLSGFGAKTEQTILKGIAIAAAANERILWKAAETIADSIRAHMSGCQEVERLEFAGSYRRGKETVGDLDILVASVDATSVMDRFSEFSGIVSTTARGDTKMSVRLDREFQVDLRVVPRESFGAALQYFTGSKEHNVVVRGLAKKRNLKINEWGVFRIDGDEDVRVAGETESDVYDTIGLPLFDPELRENRGEFDWANADAMPALVTADDIRGDLHMHTTASDGKNSIEEMAAAARAIGLSYIAITDHSKRVSMANGLDSDRLLAQWAEIDAINAAANDDFLILKGIECDILEEGGMDLPDETLAQADWVIASVHYGQRQPREQITDRILGALANPHVDMLAHPTGRLLNKREPYDVDMVAVMQAAAEHQKLMELNSNPVRLDLSDRHLIAAREFGIRIVINTDAHKTDGLANMRHGIQQARRGGLTASNVANTQPWAKMKAMIGSP